MNIKRFFHAVSFIALAAVLTACGKSVEGSYTITSEIAKGGKLTLGKETYVFSTGAAGKYEVSGDSVIFSGPFGKVMKIDGKNLVNENFRFERD